MSIVLTTKENKEFPLSFEQIKNFKLITSMLGIDDSDENTTYEISEDLKIPIDVSYDTMKKIMQFVDFELENVDKHIHEKLLFYNEYFVCSDTVLFELMNSTDYLQYEELLDKACEKLSDDILKCDSVNDVKLKFKITKEFTPEEELDIINSIM